MGRKRIGWFSWKTLTPLESVLSAPLWDVMEVISLKVARAETERLHHENELKKIKGNKKK